MPVHNFHCFDDLFGQCEKGTKMILQHAFFPVAVFQRCSISITGLLIHVAIIIIVIAVIIVSALSLVLLACPTYNDL